MQALFLAPTLPSTQKQTGADIACQSFITALVENGYDVTVLGYLRIGETLPQSNYTAVPVGTCHVETKEAKLSALLWLFKSFTLNLPYTGARYYSKNYIHAVEKYLSQSNFDVIVLDHNYQIGWIEPYISDKSKLFMIVHNVENQIYQDRANESRNFAVKWLYQRESNLIKDIEEHLTQVAKETWALTDNDARFFASVKGASSVRTLGLPPSLGNLPKIPLDKAYDIGLIGSWIWKPNGDGLRWFFQEVYPLLPKDFMIEVAGRGAEWLEGRFPNVICRGFVPDAKVFMAQSRVIAIPSIAGGGIQIKTLNSIGLGLPIVATPFALRGIDNPPSFVVAAEDPQSFAQALIDLTTASTENNPEEALIWANERKAYFIQGVKEAINSAARL
jgi:polysaccharide biosynthesis protein PslH